jgi:RNA polymerase sigma-70 factor (ECF subfamily)
MMLPDISVRAQPEAPAPADVELMAHLSLGEPAALEALYDRHAPRLFGLALRILQEPSAAEDAVQEAFLRAWRRADTYDARRGEVAAWLAAIARNTCLDVVRRQRLKPAPFDPDDDDLPRDYGDPVTDVAATVEERSRAAQVRRALAALSAEQRQVIELSYFAGLTRREIAARLDVPEGTVHTRARLALQKLRELLEL